MEEGLSSNPVVQEALNVSRKLSKYLQVDSQPMSSADSNSLWESMLTDRSLTASLLATMIAKCLIINYYETKQELSDGLFNILTSKPLVSELEKSRASSSVKNEMKKQMDLRVMVMNTISYILYHYPFDVAHFAIKRSYTAWIEDLDKGRSSREQGFENEICHLLSAPEKLDSEVMLKETVYRCAHLATIKPDLVEFYNNSASPSNKTLSDCFLFSFLMAHIRRGSHRQVIFSSATQLLTNWATMSDLKFYGLTTMLQEFVLRDPSLDLKALQSLQEAVKSFYTWPAPFCHSAARLYTDLDFRKRIPLAAHCLDYLREHPELLSKAKQDEFIHVIVNEESFCGTYLKEILAQPPLPSSHHARSRFLTVFYKFLFEEEAEVYQFSTMDQVLVNQLFSKALEILGKLVNLCSTKANLAPKMNEFRQSIEESLASLGVRPPKIPASSVGDLEIGHLPFTMSGFQGDDFSIHDRGLASPNGDEIPEVEGCRVLEKILSQHTSRTTPAKIRIVICGGDTTIGSIAWGYTALKNVKPHLFINLDLSFYIIPAGSKNRLASCLALFDPWYGRQVLFATKAVTSVVPNPIRHFGGIRARSETLPAAQKELFERRDLNPALGVPPAMFVRNMVDHYLRQGLNTVPIKTYWAEVVALSPAGSLTRRLIPFCQSLEIGFNAFTAFNAKNESLIKSGKRTSVTVSKVSKFVPPEVTVKFTEIDVAGVSHAGPQIPSKAYWAIQVSNLPRTSEYEVVKPFANCLELHLLDLENGRKIRGKPSPMEDGPVHYINYLELEDTAKRPFEVTIDNQAYSGISKIKIIPAVDPAAPSSDPLAPPKECVFPVMTFLPPLA